MLELDKDEFEKFDYKTENGVYIDFKYFGESTGLNLDLEKLISKYSQELNTYYGDVANFQRRLFETDAMYRERLAKLGMFKAGNVVFDRNKYNVETEGFPYSIEFEESLLPLVEGKIKEQGILYLNRDIARKFWASGEINNNIAKHGLVLEFDANLSIKTFCIIPNHIYNKEISEIDKLINDAKVSDQDLYVLKEELKAKTKFLLNKLNSCCTLTDFPIYKKLVSESMKNLVEDRFLKIPIKQYNLKINNLINADNFVSIFKAYTLLNDFLENNFQQELNSSIEKYTAILLRIDHFIYNVTKESENLSEENKKFLVNLINKILSSAGCHNKSK